MPRPVSSGPPTARTGKLWFALVLVGVCAVVVNFYKLGSWPWDHDEVPSLVELGVLESDHAEGRLGEQIARLPRLVPTWYSLQRVALGVLPVDEFGARVLSAVCGSLAVVLAYYFARLWRGPWFATSLAVLLGLNQCYVWLVQQNRFYSMAMLFLIVTLAAIWSKAEKQLPLAIICVVSTLLTVLSHNLTAVVFWIGGIAAIIGLALRLVPKQAGLRALLCAGVALLTYVGYLSPLMAGWVSGGTGGTNELVSFAAQLGIPTIALAGLGIACSIIRSRQSDGIAWWLLMLTGGTMLIGISPLLMDNWNPRYALFFMVPYWVFAALGVEHVALRLSNNWQRAAWLGCIALLLMPKLLSHYRDGSRHDFRTAASEVAAVLKPDELVYCDWPLTLEYYLARKLTLKHYVSQEPFSGVQPWRGSVADGPRSYVVLASNAYAPLLKIKGSHCDLMREISTRRFDEQSHVVRIYRVTTNR